MDTIYVRGTSYRLEFPAGVDEPRELKRLWSSVMDSDAAAGTIRIVRLDRTRKYGQALRSLIVLVIAVTCSFAQDFSSPEEQARIMDQIKAERKAREEQVGSNAPEKRDNGADKRKSDKDEDDSARKTARAERDSQDWEKKAIAAAKDAMRNVNQYITRKGAENGQWSDNPLQDGSTPAIQSAVKRVREYIEKMNASRTIAGIPILELVDHRDGQHQTLFDWIQEFGK